MDTEALLYHIEEALRAVTHPRFYESERGFQGEFLAQLRRVIPDKLLPLDAVIEQEYQKRLDYHRLRVRPDIIIHEPFDAGRFTSREQGNIAVLELKLAASRREAADDFDSLMSMIDALAYPLGVFINVASAQTHADALPEQAKGRIACFATALVDGSVQVTRGSG